jgi:hypothetical protein
MNDGKVLGEFFLFFFFSFPIQATENNINVDTYKQATKRSDNNVMSRLLLHVHIFSGKEYRCITAIVQLVNLNILRHS